MTTLSFFSQWTINTKKWVLQLPSRWWFYNGRYNVCLFSFNFLYSYFLYTNIFDLSHFVDLTKFLKDKCLVWFRFIAVFLIINDFTIQPPAIYCITEESVNHWDLYKGIHFSDLIKQPSILFYELICYMC